MSEWEIFREGYITTGMSHTQLSNGQKIILIEGPVDADLLQFWTKDAKSIWPQLRKFAITKETRVAITERRIWIKAPWIGKLEAAP